jgi:hypothetical protein
MIGKYDRIVLFWSEGGEIRFKKIQISEEEIISQPPLWALPLLILQ